MWWGARRLPGRPDDEIDELLDHGVRGSYATPLLSYGVVGWVGYKRSRRTRPRPARLLPRSQLLLSEFRPAHPRERTRAHHGRYRNNPRDSQRAQARASDLRETPRELSSLPRGGPAGSGAVAGDRGSGLSPRAAESGGEGGERDGKVGGLLVGGGGGGGKRGGARGREGAISRGKWRTVMKAEVIGGIKIFISANTESELHVYLSSFSQARTTVEVLLGLSKDQLAA